MKPAPPDPPEVRAALWEGTGGTTAWDVGANCGQTLPILTRRFRQVVAFEPAHECLNLLWQTCLTQAQANNATVVLRPEAISDHDGEVTLVAVPEKINTGQLVTAGIDDMEWNTADATNRSVPCRSLDSLTGELPTPQFVKVDVEGHENHVLDGACGLIADYHPSWLVEFHSRELHAYCRDLLTRYGYELHTIRHPHYQPGTDLWFSHGWLRAHWVNPDLGVFR